MATHNYFTKRAERAAKILACYSNVNECIPQPIKKAEETKLLAQAKKETMVSKDALAKAHQNFDEALQLVKGGISAKTDNKALVKKIICNAVDSGIISDQLFLEELAKLEN